MASPATNNERVVRSRDGDAAYSAHAAGSASGPVVRPAPGRLSRSWFHTELVALRVLHHRVTGIPADHAGTELFEPGRLGGPRHRVPASRPHREAGGASGLARRPDPALPAPVRDTAVHRSQRTHR